MANNKKNDDFVDDGRTVANMNFDSLGNSYDRNRKKTRYAEKQREIANLNLTRKEKWAIIKAIYARLIPFVVIMFFMFFIVTFILLTIWGY
jgi:hypothetical protein